MTQVPIAPERLSQIRQDHLDDAKSWSMTARERTMHDQRWELLDALAAVTAERDAAIMEAELAQTPVPGLGKMKGWRL